MSENKSKNIVRKEDPKSEDPKSNDVVAKLSQFIEKKRIQNEALKKIVKEFSPNEVNKKNK